MGISNLFNYPYYLSTASVTSLVPDVWDVALNGRTYMLDLKSGEFVHRSIPLLRQQADQSRSPSDASLNPEDLWRRSQDTWHKGAGQSVLDREDSDPARFDNSKGVDVWTKWQLTLLPATDQKKVSANTNLYLAVAGSYLYLTDGTSIQYTQDITVGSPTWTDITGEPATAASSLVSDGNTIYTAHGADGIYSTVRGSASTASFVTGTVSLLGHAKGRLMAANANNLYNITAAGALPAALFTHPNTDFQWTGFAEGQGAIYACGFSGDKSLIYKVGIQAGGTGLDSPIVAGELPDGEIVRSAVGYLGFVVLGTDKGVRFAVPDPDTDDLTIGALIPATTSVKAFEPQDRFVWYGWTNYDGTSTGLGRMDLTVFTGPVTPAYASDLMVTAQGEVLSIATFQSRRVFTVSGSGVWGEETTLVDSGTLDSGRFTYAVPNKKIAAFVDVVHDGTGQHSIALSADGGAFSSLGTHAAMEDPFPANNILADAFEIRSTLTTVATVGPTIRSYTLRAYPAAPTTEHIFLPLLIHEDVATNDGGDEAMDAQFELEAVRALRNTRSVISYQEGVTQYAVVVEDTEWRPHHQIRSRKAWNGTLLVKLKVIN